MFSIIVETGFRATHHVRFPDGSVEAPHAHEWRVRVTVRRATLDEVGMVADFDHVRNLLSEAVRPFENADLNTHPALSGRNPTAEVVAHAVFDRLARVRLTGLHRVEVTEAPGCVAVFDADA
jgi:6-pyruvoyltetrahydropterin/6-carboxytetrahydropterin synthase